MSHIEPTGLVVRSADAETLDDGPTSVITLLADRGETSPVTVNRASLHVGSPGAPAHLHREATELFYVLDGVARILLGEVIHELRPGDFVLVPPGVAHAFAPAASHATELLVTFSGGPPRFDYYRLLERVYRGEATLADIAASGPEFDNHYVDSPVWNSR
ncbi:MAG: cupin domain-containing protein [Pseudonocardiales bacterium]|nr:MAG: cupin domain-containing protein [Pseudonocardiales bacterium]